MKYTLVLIDDNLLDLEYMTQLIGSIGPEWEVSKVFDQPLDALSYLRLHPPDLILVDIEMAGMSGIDLVEALIPLAIPVIFVTNSDEYALKAFDLAAIDYLIKPVSKMRLSMALEKRAHINPQHFSIQFDFLKSALQSNQTQKPTFGRMIINNQQSVEVLDFKDIIYCEAKGPYSTFFLTDGKYKVATKPLKYYETFLEHHDFFRLHRSYMVNLNHIKAIDKNSLTTILVTGEPLPVTSDRLGSLIDKFKSVINAYNV